MRNVQNVQVVIKILNSIYTDLKPFLHHANAFEFLIAAILSAQTTDNMVNAITPNLFAKYPTPEALSQADVKDVENIIHKINYYKTKAKNIIAASKVLVEKFGGDVPRSVSELISLPGVGRKVANVVCSDYYEDPQGFVVDTHVKRVSRRLGWTMHVDPEKIEEDIIRIVNKKHWIQLPKQLISIGRAYCFPRSPDCENCPLNQVCPKNLQ